MTNDKNHEWVDNPTEAGVAECDPDILNDCLMYLRYNAASGNGIPPMAIKNKEIVNGGTKNILTWQDPDDSIISGVELATWGGTLIVRKEGSYPEDYMDGTIVCNNTVRNQYAVTGFEDEIGAPNEENPVEYFYRAFPYTVNKVYNMSSANMFGAWLYGYCELDNEGAPGQRYEYLEENKNFDPCYMNFTSDLFNWGSWGNNPLVSWNNVKPCMLYNNSSGQNGQVAYYLNPNDFTKIFNSDVASDIANKTFAGNAMVQIRKVFTKIVTKNDEKGRRTYVYFSNVKLDSGFECYQCKRADGTYNEYFYVPIYNGSLIDGVLRSISGQTVINSRTAQNEIDYARQNGPGWDTELFSANQYLIRLFKLLFKNANSQAALGQGKSDGGNSVAACLQTGTMNKRGMMWGSSSTSVGVKFMYIENFWGSQWRRYRGHIVKNGVHYVKMTKSTVDGSTAEDYNITGDGYIKLSDIPAATGSSGGYISQSVENQYGRFGTVISGSATTYLCDGTWFNNGIVAYPFRGGDSYNGALCGVSCFVSDVVASHASWNLGAALSYTPL